MVSVLCGYFRYSFFVVLVFFMRGMFCRGSSGCGSHSDDATHNKNAREILDKRFAKGEITTTEYDEMKKALDNKQ